MVQVYIVKSLLNILNLVNKLPNKTFKKQMI